MSTVTYEIVEHDGGWTWKVGDTFAQAYASKEAALAAAARAAREHATIPPEPTDIDYETADGRWRTEHVSPQDSPDTEVVDPAAPGEDPETGPVPEPL